jgi:outer membrane lipoprotein SlyB
MFLVCDGFAILAQPRAALPEPPKQGAHLTFGVAGAPRYTCHMRAALLLMLLLAACANRGQTLYSDQEVGLGVKAVFGTILRARDVEIVGRGGAPSGSAAMVSTGGSLAGFAGSVVNPVGTMVSATQDVIAQRSRWTGVEYTIVLQTGDIVTLAQYRNAEDTVFGPGARVLVQLAGAYQRVLPAEGLPDAAEKPKGLLFN